LCDVAQVNNEPSSQRWRITYSRAGIAILRIVDNAEPPSDVDPSSVVVALLGEVGRKNDEYRRQAVVSLGEVLAHYQSTERLDHFAAIYNELLPLIQVEESTSTTMDTSGTNTTSSTNSTTTQAQQQRQAQDEEDKLKRPRRMAIQAASITTLAKAWPTNTTTQSQYMEQFLALLLPILAHSAWNIKVAILNAVVSVFTTTIANHPDALVLVQQPLAVYLPHIQSCVCDNKFAAVKEAGIKCIEALMSFDNDQRMDCCAAMGWLLNRILLTD
jgi:hypothetical protein